VVDIQQYLTKENKLNHEKLWRELSAITGFQAEKKRGVRYYEVTEAYKAYKESIKTTNNDSRPLDTQDSVLHNPNTQVPRSHKITEDFVISYINKEAKSTFVKSDDFCHYDAEEPRYIAEIKVRNKHYDNCIIEYDKYMSNLGTSAIEGKEFLYIVATTTDIYVFNVTRLSSQEYSFGWIKKELPVNSHFGGYNDKKMKRVGYINIKDASVCYNYKS
tara:strand:- start:2708 stop:3358 length:651 start_codon:yes stop_codon:yes gene_type:complete